ncbi:hypothetical protein J1N10_19350 [Carboxylicivirga sp. A043]|uniref:hypothetical protein n=1 Tax=Carboxylicivirga litoralis TaxID=2816963 RepID=UPI0021CB30F5|nr:hypothetical protein [Carboxylicivirga sp. A043]MCU4158139.1 hypothetical protein [Carboxylicivirga sp. A043]
MKKFIFNTFIFIIILISLIWIYTKGGNSVLREYLGPNTQQQIDQSFKNALERDYTTLILGNSRIYRGINPDLCCSPSYNFAHDNDSYNQIYYKLKYILNCKKNIKNIILGVDYFQFSFISENRNYAYGKHLGKEYLKDYDYSFNYFYEYENIRGINKFLTIYRASKEIIQKNETSKKTTLKGNGQYLMPIPNMQKAKLTRDPKRLLIQEKYFSQIIELCKERNVNVFLVMPPLQAEEIMLYNEDVIKEFENYIKSFSADYIDYYNYSSTGLFTSNDFTDITHLNCSGADKFSRFINDSIESCYNYY